MNHLRQGLQLESLIMHQQQLKLLAPCYNSNAVKCRLPVLVRLCWGRIWAPTGASNEVLCSKRFPPCDLLPSKAPRRGKGDRLESSSAFMKAGRGFLRCCRLLSRASLRPATVTAVQRAICTVRLHSSANACDQKEQLGWDMQSRPLEALEQARPEV